MENKQSIYLFLLKKKKKLKLYTPLVFISSLNNLL